MARFASSAAMTVFPVPARCHYRNSSAKIADIIAWFLVCFNAGREECGEYAVRESLRAVRGGVAEGLIPSTIFPQQKKQQIVHILNILLSEYIR